ncbi:TetR/AcrR family transcriptional regulator [Nocardia macrotermitis]|uniref:TetR/AcrR family transcriptional regulator n=1 Tax=Nocardia macrotermitis TaxID=2585198 RepID=UPI0029E7EE0D|nr:TetR/AcrR family transcriptional regulator [Nocardia macrotermitis]
MTSTRDRILDALENLLLEQGISQVTLENVAAAAGVSKGGLLYHFKNKDALLTGLVQRLGERADDQVEHAVAQGRSLAEWHLQSPDVTNESDALELALYRSMVAAMRTVDAHDQRANPVQQALTGVLESWKSGLDTEFEDPVHAEIVRLVGDGVYLRALLGLPPIDPDRYREVVARLLNPAAS